MNADKSYLEHEKIGFPALSSDEQCRLLLTRNVKILNNLTPGYRMYVISPALFRAYVTISRSEFKAYFEKSGYIDRLNEQHQEQPMRDGEWVESLEDGRFEQKVQERGHIVHGESFLDYDALINHYVREFYDKTML